MRAASSKIRDAANIIKKGIGETLHFSFNEERGYTNGGYFRRRKVSSEFTVNAEICEQLSRWLNGNQMYHNPLHLQNEHIDVIVKQPNNKPHKLFNFFSSMPPVAYSLSDNPLYEALSRKRKQLRGVTRNERRVLFLGDAGSTLLRDVGRPKFGFGHVSGDEIIRHFLTKNDVIDLICVFSPKAPQDILQRRMQGLSWKLTLFPKPECAKSIDQEAFNQILNVLPKPRFEGYQARSLQLQKACQPQAMGWYHGISYSHGQFGGKMELSARALIDLLAGRISYETFCHFSGLTEEKNVFRNLLNNGNTIQGISFESSGIDKDDDKIVFEFKKDPGASPFR